MSLESLVLSAAQLGASDLHIEVGLFPTLRVGGKLVPMGERLTGEEVRGMVRQIVSKDAIGELDEKLSFDVAKTIGGPVAASTSCIACAAWALLYAFFPNSYQLSNH